MGRLRFFLNTRYTRGWHRGEGAGSLVRFSKDIRPTSFDTYVAGSNRLLINTETVVFTPLQPQGFRIALFGFAAGHIDVTFQVVCVRIREGLVEQ